MERSEREGERAFQKRVVAAAGCARKLPRVQELLTSTLEPLMVRHTKADLQLPAPIRLPTGEGYLPQLEAAADRGYSLGRSWVYALWSQTASAATPVVRPMSSLGSHTCRMCSPFHESRTQK